MAQRVTKSDVRAAFVSLIAFAKGAGIVGTEGWQLHIGNSTYGYQYRITDAHGHTVGRSLGCTAREAREAIWNLREGIYIVEQSQRKD